MTSPIGVLSGVVLDSRDPRALCDFYERLLGWKRTAYEEDWCKLMPEGGSTGVSFQREPLYRAPTWPSGDGEQMQLHLDFAVDDLAAGVEHAAACGARLADWQPQEHVRVMLDPAGHPFCLFLAGVG
jgi:catechol 2,3-dioxygenase-like lactoylglutathione lyase family enzyme